jgi:hypothetical protein
VVVVVVVLPEELSEDRGGRERRTPDGRPQKPTACRRVRKKEEEGEGPRPNTTAQKYIYGKKNARAEAEKKGQRKEYLDTPKASDRTTFQSFQRSERRA